jgi:hypothetical protein
MRLPEDDPKCGLKHVKTNLSSYVGLFLLLYWRRAHFSSQYNRTHSHATFTIASFNWDVNYLQQNDYNDLVVYFKLEVLSHIF